MSVYKCAFSVIPDLIRHPEGVETKAGNHVKYWIPVFTGNSGFRLDFTPYLIRGRNDDLYGYCSFMDRHYYEDLALRSCEGRWPWQTYHP